ncbi:MAG: transposase [Chitinophagaceae bacterium]
MSSSYKFDDPDGYYFITHTVINWVDVFTRKEYKQILLDSWKHCQQTKGLQIHAWVIMTNHIHMIISRNGETKLEDIMRDMKKYTSSQIVAAIMYNEQESRREWMLNIFSEAGKVNSNNKNYQFWKQDNHPMLLATDKFIAQKLSYIHENPIRAGFVQEASHWQYSSAIDYDRNKKGLVDIVII